MASPFMVQTRTKAVKRAAPFRGRSHKHEKNADDSWTPLARGLAIALLTAILTGAVSYAYGVANEIRKAELGFVNAQLEKLYGPLYAASQADDAIWKLFMAHQWRNADAQDESPVFFDNENPPSADQVRRWRHWMRTVFQPLNLKMEEAIVANSHLLVGDTVPMAFRDLIAHTEAYKAVIAAWDADDFKLCQQPTSRPQVDSPCSAVTTERNTARINFPEDVVQCVAEDYVKLKQHQQELQSGFISAFFAHSVVRSPRCR